MPWLLIRSRIFRHTLMRREHARVKGVSGRHRFAGRTCRPPRGHRSRTPCPARPAGSTAAALHPIKSPHTGTIQYPARLPTSVRSADRQNRSPFSQAPEPTRSSHRRSGRANVLRQTSGRSNTARPPSVPFGVNSEGTSPNVEFEHEIARVCSAVEAVRAAPPFRPLGGPQREAPTPA